MSAATIVIPTLGRPALLRRVLDRLDAQTAPPGSLAVNVVGDAKEEHPEALEEGGRRAPLRGARAARAPARRIRSADAGWRAAATPLVLFLDDDILPEPALVAEHLAWHEHGFRLLYNSAAVAEHVHPMDVEFWKRQVARIAVSEREFTAMHPGFTPYFHELFSKTAAQPPPRGRLARLARFVPRGAPLLGARVWASADAVYRHALAPPFLEAWEAAGREA